VTEDTVTGPYLADTSDSGAYDGFEPTNIVDRRRRAKLLAPGQDAPDTPRLGQAATQLCRLAFHLANQTDVVSVAKVALEGLFEGTQADAAAVLLGPADGGDDFTVADLRVVGTRSRSDANYHHVSSFLAGTVLREREAVLARNVSGDSTLGTHDSKGEIESTSVICAPIRQDNGVVGLIHLYSVSAERSLDPEDLEFTLAVADNLALALKNLGRQQELAENLQQSQTEVVQLRKQLGAESEIIGGSVPIKRLQQAILQAAPSRATVLIRGESGVGKELVARAIHFSSPRAKGPFVCLNCAALSETLLESELFGHEKGAFTGATERKIGKFESADRGTLMLDEIGEMSPSIQAKFLRVLEGHPFERVGGNQAIRVDVRVIAATNRDLEKDVAEGKFRRDLYFRLHVVEILVPPLRKRSEDVVELAAHFLERFTGETGRKIRGFTPAAIEHLQKYRWPGNVRELKNVIERAVVLARGDRIDTEDLVLSNLAPSSESGELASPAARYEPVTLEEVERRHILATLSAENWNKSRTATVLGIERSTLDRKIRRYDLKPSDGN
jgi:Nif-specific regulatory protein